jgi:nucleoside permease NupC
MTGGFATVAGSVLAAYINLGIPANHLVVASLMAGYFLRIIFNLLYSIFSNNHFFSAPGALLVSKTLFPETKTTKASWKEIENIPKG